MWIAEYQHFSGLSLFLQELIIHFETVFRVNQRIEDEFAVVAFHGMEKWRIDRRLNDYLITFLSQAHDSHIECRDNARSICHPFCFHIPSVTAMNPIGDGLKISFFTESVAVNIIFCALNHSVSDEIRSTEIHVGDPHRDDIGFTEDFFS